MASQIRRWLQKQPHPATVRGLRSDGEEVTAKIGVERSKWQDAERVLAGCVRLEAFDGDGASLRVWGDDADVDELSSLAKRATNPALVELARIISDAHDKGAARCEGAYQLGFERLISLAEAAYKRMEGLERAYFKLLNMQDGSGQGPDRDTMIMQLLATRLPGGVVPPGGPPNGAG